MLAHAETGPIDWTGLVFVAVFVVAAAVWLVRINHRLDAEEAPMTDTSSPRQQRTWLLGALVAVVLLGGVVGAIALYRARAQPTAVAAQAVVDDLCLAAEQANTDTEEALGTFNGSPHDALHRLDARLRISDPIAAARLADAKAQAEASLIAGQEDASTLTATLAEETAVAYRLLEPGKRVDDCT